MVDRLRDVTFTQEIVVDYLRNADRSDIGWDHYHDYYEIYYYTGNHMTYFISDKTYNVHENEVVLVDRFLMHRTFYKPDQRRDRVLILFSSDLVDSLGSREQVKAVERMFSHRKMTIIDEAQHGRMRQLIFSMVATNADVTSPTRSLQLRYQLYALLLLMSGFGEETVLFNLEPSESSPSEQLVERAIVYINENFRNKVTLESIASELYVSKYHLSRVFNEVANTSITKFINAKRLSEAERLLRDTDLPIRRIAHEVGISSESYFSKLFKNKYYCTPQEFRDRLYGAQLLD